MITAVALSPALDVTYVVDELVIGGIHRPAETIKVAGGKSLNAARAAATLGADVAAVATVGGGTGSTIAAGAVAAGVDLRALSTPTESRTCISMFSCEGESLTELYEQPSPISLSEWEAVLTSVREMVAVRPGWLIVSGATPISLPTDALLQLVRAARSAGLNVALDSYGEQMAHALDMGDVDVVKVNRSEAAELLGSSVDIDISSLARALQRETRGVVVLTDGVDGAVATDGSTFLRARLSTPVGHFPVGSGDSFLGGLVAGLDAGKGLSEAMRIAVACGTANALVPGAARFSRNSAEALIGDVEVTYMPDGVAAVI